MNVLVDTPVWSLALRRPSDRLNVSEERVVDELSDLIKDGRARLIGPVRQELLSGVREKPQFTRLQKALRAFPDIAITTADYETAAEFSNRCRSAGVATTPTDMLLCAVTVRRHWNVFTSDRDFERYSRSCSVRLHYPKP